MPLGKATGTHRTTAAHRHAEDVARRFVHWFLHWPTTHPPTSRHIHDWVAAVQLEPRWRHGRCTRTLPLRVVRAALVVLQHTASAIDIDGAGTHHGRQMSGVHLGRWLQPRGGVCGCVCVCGVFGCMYVSIRRVCMRCARSPPPPCQPQELHTCRPPRADDAQTLWDVYVSEWSRTGCTATARARREKLRRWQHMVRRRQQTSDSNHVVVPLERPRDRPVAASENGWGGGTETYIRFFASVRWSDAPRVLEMFAAMHAIIDRFRATGAVRRARTLLLGTLGLSRTAWKGAKGSVRRRTFAPSITYAVPSFRAPARLSSPRWMG
jgi:hypothetical protein